jgi:hypothetical protein
MILRSLVAGTVVVLLLACGGGDDAGGDDSYSAALRSQFVVDCVAQGTPQDQCGCLYDKLEDDVPFARFEKLDEAIRSGAREVPDDVADLAAACAGDPAPG